MRSRGLFWQVFLSILAVSLAAILATGLIARRALEAAFASYLQAYPARGMGPGSGTGRQMLLGTAERTFLAGVDQGILVSAGVAIVFALVTAALLARYLTDPLRRLTTAARALSAGELEHRVLVRGPQEVAELSGAFNDMAASLERAEELRRRLVTDVAHELRNPIASVRAQVEGVADGVLPADEAHLTSLVEDVGTLSRLVDDLQELSVAEAGRLRYDRGTVDLCAIARAEVDRARATTGDGVELRVECPTSPVLLLGDEFRVAQVVRNLLSNAARHTREGVIVVRLSLEDRRAVLAVSDTGEGIAEADLPYIWERFYRADAARAAGTGGTGVGLAISKRIVEDHGGVVFARSTIGAGAEVGFSIPLDDA